MFRAFYNYSENFRARSSRTLCIRGLGRFLVADKGARILTCQGAQSGVDPALTTIAHMKNSVV